MLTAVNQALSDLGFGAFVKNRPPVSPSAPVNPPLPPSAWQPPPRYYAGPPARTPYTPPISPRSSLPNRLPTVNNAYTPGANYRPSVRPVNPTATPAPSVKAPLAAPVASPLKTPILPYVPVAQIPQSRLPAGAYYPELPLGALGNQATIPYVPRPADIPAWAWPFPEPPQPKDLDPAAMDAGPTLTPGTPPPFTGGQSPGVGYIVTVQWNTVQVSGATTPTPNIVTRGGAFLIGPIRGLELLGQPGGESLNLLYGSGQAEFLGSSSAAQGGFRNQKITNIVRADGQPDTGGNPAGGTAPVRAPNPARQPTAAAPRTLPTAPPNTIGSPIATPTPTPTPTAADLPWPQTPAKTTPDTAPLTPSAPVPNFSPTPTPDPLPLPTPGTTSPPADLEAPGDTPTNLPDNPKTPPVDDLKTPVNEPFKITWPGLGDLSIGGASTSPLAVAIPVVLLAGLSQKVNTPSGDLNDRTKPNPNLQTITRPPVPSPPVPNPPTCSYERQRVMDIQNKATDTQQRAANPVSGFPGLYGIGIESRVKLGQTFDLLGTVNSFMQKAWETTRLQKVINALTLVTVLHNASMISRDVGETLGQALAQGLDVLGIEDEKGNALDVNGWFGTQANNFFKNIFGEERWKGINVAWNKANRIIASASNIVNTIRSISDGVREVTEMAAENTGKIGNALKRSGIVTERSYPWMAEKVRAQDAWSRKTARVMDGLESAENVASSLAQVTGNVKEIQEEITELEEQTTAFKALVGTPPETPKVATPEENAAIVTAGDEGATNAKAGPAVTATDMEPGTDAAT